MGAVVMDGAVVEKNALVAAGAVVVPGTRWVEFYARIPVKFLRILRSFFF